MCPLVVDSNIESNQFLPTKRENESIFSLVFCPPYKITSRPIPQNRTKFDAVFMELFYTTLAAEVILF